MEILQNKLQKLIELMGFSNFSVSYSKESGRFLVFLSEKEDIKKLLPHFVADLDYLVKLIAKKNDFGIVFVDINNYRLERESLILELARATAKKVIMTKENISLPAMNSYERRLIHLELVNRSDIATESIGQDKERRVMIKLV